MTCLHWTRTHSSQCWKVWIQEPLVRHFESVFGTAHMGLLGDETLGDSVVILTQERFEVQSVDLHRTLSLASVNLAQGRDDCASG